MVVMYCNGDTSGSITHSNKSSNKDYLEVRLLRDTDSGIEILSAEPDSNEFEFYFEKVSVQHEKTINYFQLLPVEVPATSINIKDKIVSEIGYNKFPALAVYGELKTSKRAKLSDISPLKLTDINQYFSEKICENIFESFNNNIYSTFKKYMTDPHNILRRNARECSYQSSAYFDTNKKDLKDLLKLAENKSLGALINLSKVSFEPTNMFMVADGSWHDTDTLKDVSSKSSKLTLEGQFKVNFSVDIYSIESLNITEKKQRKYISSYNLYHEKI